MKNKKLCPHCRSKKTQMNYDGSVKCLNCKRTSKENQKKLTGEGVMSVFMAFAVSIMIIFSWLDFVNGFLCKNIFVYLIGLFIISLLCGKAIMIIYKKNRK